MKLTDFQRLQKFMQLTASENDAEALAAIRQANALLIRCGVNWERFFKRTVTLEIENATEDGGASVSEDEELDIAFQKALDKVPSGNFRGVLLDIQAQWQERRFLSKRQKEVVFNAARR